MRRGNWCSEPNKQPAACMASAARRNAQVKKDKNDNSSILWSSSLSSLHFALLKGTFVTIQHLWRSAEYRCNDVYLFPRSWLCGRKSIMFVVMWLIIKAAPFTHQPFFFKGIKVKKRCILPSRYSSFILRRWRLLPLELCRNVRRAAFHSSDHSSCVSVTQQIVWLSVTFDNARWGLS